MRLPKGKQLVFIDNLNPIMARKMPWYEDVELKELGVDIYAAQDGNVGQDGEEVA